MRAAVRVLVLGLVIGAAAGCRAETSDAAREPRSADAAPLPADRPPAADAPVTGDLSPARPADAGVPAPAGASNGSSPATGAGSPPPTSAPAPARPGDPSAEQILDRVERAYADVRTLRADFVQRLQVPLLGSERESRGRIFQRRPDRFAMRFTEPAGDLLVGDGEWFWMYNPSSDRTQVLRTLMSSVGGSVDLQQEFLSNASERYVPTLLGSEEVDGRPAYALTLVPKAASPYRLVKVWVDKGDWLVRRFEITEENESVRRLLLRNLTLNSTLADSLFRFTPPEGTQIFTR